MSNNRDPGDQDARNQIASDLSRNLLVEAGAGSGKTHAMAQRLAAGIAEGIYQVDHVAAVTFTRKAAAELRGRFQLALEHELGQPGHNSGERDLRLHNALSNLERFFAGTIHSFCARLLRERPVEAGVAPGFVELDEVADALLRRKSWRDFLTAMKASGDPGVTELEDAGIKPKDLDKAFRMLCMYEDVDFPPGNGRQPDPAATLVALDAFWEQLSRKLPGQIRPETTCRTQKAAVQYVRQARVASSRRTRPRTLVSLLEIWEYEPRITQNCWADDTKTKKRLSLEITGLHGSFRSDFVLPFLRAWRRYIYSLSVTLLAQARERAASERRHANALNYGDLLQLAARVLRNNADVRRALQQKYRWLFVDEFQDTDPVQAEIIFLLAGQENTASEKDVSVDWRSWPLRPGALFVVGDPKQSIYRFRRADIDIYNIVRQRLSDPTCGNVLSLTTNFRSVPALCEWANTTFEKQFPSEPTAQSPKFTRLDPYRTSPSAASANSDRGIFGVYTLTMPDTLQQGEIPDAEAEKIAHFIRGEVDAKRRSFGDFLVLTRKKDELGCYVDALEALNVPVEVSGAGAFGQSKEVEQLSLLLRALSDPQDSTSLVGLMRGPLFGLSDQALFAFRQAGGWFSIFNTDQQTGASAPNPKHTVHSALTSLRQMFRWTRVLPAGAALERILEHTGYMALAATSAGGVEAGDLLHAIDRVRQVVECGLSLAEAASAIELDGDTSSEVESLPLEPGRSDVVRVMNLHKAKGLEAPVVFLADPCGGFNPRVDVRIVRNGLTAQGYFSMTRKTGEQKPKVIAEPLDWDTYETEELTYLAAEEHRLLYVAGTRARDALIIGRWAKLGGRVIRAWAAFDPFLADATELPVSAAVSVPVSQWVDLSETARKSYETARQAAHQRIRLPSWSTTSVTAEARHIPKIARSVESDLDDPSRVLVVDTPSRRADAGMAWGTLIHGLLEHAMRHQDATRDDLTRLAMWLTVEQLELRPVISEAVSVVEAFSSSEFWQLASGSEHFVELPFCFANAPNSLLTGIIDLVFKNRDAWEIADYKTDLDPAESSARYQLQLDAYRKALTACGIEIADTSIRSVRTVQVTEAKG